MIQSMSRHHFLLKISTAIILLLASAQHSFGQKTTTQEEEVYATPVPIVKDSIDINLPSIVGTPYPSPVIEPEKIISKKIELVVEQPPASPVHPSNSDIVDFSKRIYSALGSKSVGDLATDFKVEFETLNSDGLLGETLSSLSAMRLDDLQRSVRHAKKMRDLLNLLDKDHYTANGSG
jgi:hypothetical protein